MESKFSQGPPLEKFLGNLFNFAKKLPQWRKYFNISRNICFHQSSPSLLLRYELHYLNTRWCYWILNFLKGTFPKDRSFYLLVQECILFGDAPEHVLMSSEKRRPAQCTITFICPKYTEGSVCKVSSDIQYSASATTTTEGNKPHLQCLAYSAPVNLAKENRGWFFTSPHVTVMASLSAKGKLQVSHYVKKDDTGLCVTSADSGCSVCFVQLWQPSELMFWTFPLNALNQVVTKVGLIFRNINPKSSRFKIQDSFIIIVSRVYNKIVMPSESSCSCLLQSSNELSHLPKETVWGHDLGYI